MPQSHEEITQIVRFSYWTMPFLLIPLPLLEVSGSEFSKNLGLGQGLDHFLGFELGLEVETLII